MAPIVTNHRVIICVGSGGVGKTTTAAAIALWGALTGRRTAVVTIDPAKRLADCLGIEAGNVEGTLVKPEAFQAYGLHPQGSLTALLVDQSKAWDAAIARYAPTEEIRDQILANRFYQGLSRTFAGSHEYIALDTLASLVQQGTYDLVVVDTPPIRHTLDFLEAPQRLQRFLDSRARKWFIRSPASGGWSMLSAVNKTTTFLLRKIEEATGISALAEISEFFTTMQGMFDDFGERFQRVSALLASDETAFFLVTTLEEDILTEAKRFLNGLERLNISPKAIIFNRVHEESTTMKLHEQDRSTLAEQLCHTLEIPGKTPLAIEWLIENFFTYQTLAHTEAIRHKNFSRQLPEGMLFLRVPILPTFPGDMSGLVSLHPYLFPAADKRKQRRTKEIAAITAKNGRH
ncbi:MAG: ArsA family ATPase [Candidatus Binatia bacterium]